MNLIGTRISVPSLCNSQSKPQDFHGGYRIPEITPIGVLEKQSYLQLASCKSKGVISMRDRSKNRKPLQRGRVSIEVILTVQALKRSKNDTSSLEQVFQSKIRRLVKSDLIAVLRELQRQNEGLLALQVFEDVRKEYWYKPQVLMYAEVIKVLANNGLFEKVELLFWCLKMESNLEGDTEGFNALLTTLMEYNIIGLAMECFHLMKAVGCEPDKMTFKILINGLEKKGERGLSSIMRQEAEKYFRGSVEFLEEIEDVLESSRSC